MYIYITHVCHLIKSVTIDKEFFEALGPVSQETVLQAITMIKFTFMATIAVILNSVRKQSSKAG